MVVPREKTIFELNNEAIFELQQQRHNQAIGKFHEIFALVQKEFAASSSVDSSQKDDRKEAPVLLTVPVNERLLSATQADMVEVPDSPKSEASGFRIFDQAFIAAFPVNDLPGADHRFHEAFLLYNLGLCYHHQEVKADHKKNLHGLQMALAFYNMALAVMETQGACDDGRPEDVLILLLALFNNLGHIYSSFFCMIPETRNCANWIRKLLSSPKTSELFMKAGDDLNFFCLTAAIVPPVPFSFAPAA